MKGKRIALFILSAFAVLLLSGCVPGDGTNHSGNEAGFFWGVWHGWIAPVSLVLGLFNHEIRIYEMYNSGWWYDFGYYIAVISGFGGISFFRRKNTSKDR